MMDHNYNRFRFAFTLSEVLITLAIIGVVAAITMPSLINNIQDRQFIAKWKKAYSIINNAVYLASGEYEFCKGTFIEYSGTTNLCSKEQIIETYRQVLSKLNFADACLGNSGKSYDILGIRTCNQGELTHIKDNNSPKCKSLSGDYDGYCADDAASVTAILKDGTWLYFAGPFWNAPKILVDVNGPAGPNTVGRDMYVVFLVKNKAIPYGAEKNYGKDENICAKNAVSSPMFGSFTYANGSGLAGAGCSSEYLYK